MLIDSLFHCLFNSDLFIIWFNYWFFKLFDFLILDPTGSSVSQAEKKEVDARSIYVGNVSFTYLWFYILYMINSDFMLCRYSILYLKYVMCKCSSRTFRCMLVFAYIWFLLLLCSFCGWDVNFLIYGFVSLSISYELWWCICIIWSGRVTYKMYVFSFELKRVEAHKISNIWTHTFNCV